MADSWKWLRAKIGVIDTVIYHSLLLSSQLSDILLAPIHSFSNQTSVEMKSSRHLLAQIFATALYVAAGPLSPGPPSEAISKIAFNVDFSNVMASLPVHDRKRAIALTSVADKRDLPIDDVSIKAVNDLVYLFSLFMLDAINQSYV